jgi:hypothetical protein
MGDSIRMINKPIGYLIRVRMLGVEVCRDIREKSEFGLKNNICKMVYYNLLPMKNLCPNWYACTIWKVKPISPIGLDWR